MVKCITASCFVCQAAFVLAGLGWWTQTEQTGLDLVNERLCGRWGLHVKCLGLWRNRTKFTK